LQNNNLIGELPQEILKLVHLQELDLHKKSINWYNSFFYRKVKRIKVLNLSFNRLTGTIPSSICDISKLKDLQLYMNAITGELPMHIGI
jgi:Leucine-rich repeat (LRR) protein